MLKIVTQYSLVTMATSYDIHVATTDSQPHGRLFVYFYHCCAINSIKFEKKENGLENTWKSDDWHEWFDNTIGLKCVLC